METICMKSKILFSVENTKKKKKKKKHRQFVVWRISQEGGKG